VRVLPDIFLRFLILPAEAFVLLMEERSLFLQGARALLRLGELRVELLAGFPAAARGLRSLLTFPPAKRVRSPGGAGVPRRACFSRSTSRARVFSSSWTDIAMVVLQVADARFELPRLRHGLLHLGRQAEALLLHRSSA